MTSIFAEPGCHDVSIYSEEGIYNSPSASALALPFMVNPGQGAPQDVYFDSFLTLYYHHFGGLCNQPFYLSPSDDVLDESFHTAGSTCLFPDQFEASPSFQTDDFWLWALSAALVQNCPTAVQGEVPLGVITTYSRDLCLDLNLGLQHNFAEYGMVHSAGCFDTPEGNSPFNFEAYIEQDALSICVLAGCADPEASNYNPNVTHPYNNDCVYGADPFDLNFDGNVDVPDLLVMLENLGCANPNCPGDVTEDGEVDINDLLVFLTRF